MTRAANLLIRLLLIVVCVAVAVSAGAQSVSSLSLNPTSVIGGNGSTGTVTISAAAPSGGLAVALATQSSYYVPVPASVTVPAGTTTATFAISTNPYTSTFTNLIKASANGTSQSATLTVIGDSLASLSVNPSSLVGGQASVGTVTLTAAAPTGGWNVSFTSQSSYYVSVPSSISVPAGATSATFNISTKAYSTTYTNVIQASDSDSHQRATITVIGDSVGSLSVSPTQVVGGNGSTGTVTLTAAAPSGGWVVNLIDNVNGYVNVPTSITIPAGSTTGTFNITTNPYSSTFSCVIQASDSVSHQRATLTVIGDSVASLTLNPSTVVQGSGSVGTVVLTAAAPTGGWTINLTTNSTFVQVPSSFVIPAGSTSGTFNLTTTVANSTFTAVVQAADTTTHQRANLTALRDGVQSVTLTPTSVIGGNSSLGQINLDNPAPIGGWTVNLTSQTPGSVTVPASVTISEGSTSTQFPISTTSATQAYSNTISAADSNTTQTTTLVVTTGGLANSSWPRQGGDVTNTGRSTGYGALGNLKWMVQPSPVHNIAGGVAIGSDGTIYWGQVGLYAYNPASGALLWSAAMGGNVISNPAIGSNGFVYVGSQDKSIYALNASTGTQQWKYSTGGQVTDSPAIGPDGTIYVGSTDDYLYALNGQTGALKWRYKSGGQVTGSSPALGIDGTVYFAANSVLYAVNGSNGTLKWKYSSASAIYQTAPVIGWDGSVYFSAPSSSTPGTSTLYNLNPQTGAINWSFDGNIGTTPAIGPDGTIYVGYGYSIYAYQPVTGVQLWSYTMDGGALTTPSVGTDGTVYMSEQFGNFYAFDGQTGDLNWAYFVQGAGGSQPAIGSDGTIYEGFGNGIIYAFN